MENGTRLSHAERQFMRMMSCARNTKNAKRKQAFMVAARRWAVRVSETDADRAARKEKEAHDWATKQCLSVDRRSARQYRREHRDEIEAAFAAQWEAKQVIKRAARAARAEKQRLAQAARIMRDTETVARRAAKAIRVREAAAARRAASRLPPLPY